MKAPTPSRIRLPAVLCALIASWSLLQAQTVTQSITLNPGWNAIWLEVEPDENATGEVFAALDVGSVWAWLEPGTGAEFIQSASEEAFDRAGWQRWFPPSREESIFNNLFRLQAHRAYLVRFDETTSKVLSLTGRPSLRRPEWSPDSFNLRGAPVDPAVLPSFLEFFRHSPAHYDAEQSKLRPIYRLNGASGRWEEVADTDTVEHGRAYWFQIEGASDFSGPLDLELEFGDGLDFGLEVAQLDLKFRNLRPNPVNALVSDSAPGSGVLSYLSFDPVAGNRWDPLPSPLALAVEPGTDTRLTLAVRRQDQNTAERSSVLEVRDGAGTRFLLPTRSEKFGVSEGLLAHGDNPLAGLWIGSATLNAVSEAHATDSTTPTPTPSELSLRLILHVDHDGQVRLLKEVTQMWRDGTFTSGAGGEQVIDRPGEYVLLTNSNLIPRFSGAVARDGEAVGRRLSTIGYDFPSTPGSNYLALSGTFGTGGSLAGTLTIPADHPTNPFKHRYHPDHDNLNERFDGPADESFDVTRSLSLTFAADPPAGRQVADFGYSEMAGSYAETITGIHRNPLHLAGSFSLTRISVISELDPDPGPESSPQQ